MNRPSKKDLKAAVDKLKDNSSGGSNGFEPIAKKPTPKQSNQRIRKQGV